MANLLGWIGQRAKAVEAQVNPFDNGQTYNTVRQNIPTAPAPSIVSQVTHPVARLANNIQHPSQLYNPLIRPVLASPLANTAKIITADISHNPVARANASIGLKQSYVDLNKRLQNPAYATDLAAGLAHGVPKLTPTKAVGKNVKLSPDELKLLQKQGFDDKTITKLAGPQGQKITLPKTPIKPKSTYQAPLPPAQPLGAAVKNLANKVTVLKKIDTPSSHALANHITAIDNLQQSLRGIAKNRMPVTFSLKPDEFSNLGNVVEHGAKPINNQVAKAVTEAKAVFPDIHSAFSKAGGKTGNVSNYFPRDYSSLKIGSPNYNQALQHLVSSGQAKDLTEAVGMLRGVARGKGTSPSFFGNFDRPRLDVPGYGYTKDALQKYLNGAAQKTAEVTHFGPKGKVADQLIVNVAKEGGDTQLASKAVQNYLHSANTGKADYLASARGFFGAARLGKAPISHLGQSTNIPLVTRLRDLPTAAFKGLTKEGRNYINESDVNNPANVHGLTHQETSVKGALSKVTAAGLTPVMKVNRGLASLAGREYGNYLAAKGSEVELRDLGVTGDIGKTLTRDQQHQVSRGVTNKTMFNPSRAQTAVGAETSIGKTIGQYRTAYGYKQTGLIWNNVIKAAGNGDLKPLGKFLALSAPVAVGTIAVKNKVSGHKEGPGGLAIDTIGALGGIPGELAVQAARYAKGNILKTTAGAVAPLAGEAVDIGQRTQDAIKDKYGKHNLKGIEGYGAGLAPVVGGRLSKAVYGPTRAEKTAKAVQQTGNPDIASIKANPPKGFSLQKTSDGKYAYTLDDGNVQTTSNLKTAQTALAEAQFKQEGISYKTVGDVVYRKAADGTVNTTTKTKFDYQIGTATLTAQKNAGDVQGWLTTANSQLDSIDKQLKDPNIDPLDALTLQNDATALQNNIDKYSGYGGFTKPKSGSSRTSKSAKAITSFKTSSSGKAPPKPKGVSVRVPKASFKAPKTRKLSVSKIPTNYTKRKLG